MAAKRADDLLAELFEMTSEHVKCLDGSQNGRRDRQNSIQFKRAMACAIDRLGRSLIDLLGTIQHRKPVALICTSTKQRRRVREVTATGSKCQRVTNSHALCCNERRRVTCATEGYQLLLSDG